MTKYTRTFYFLGLILIMALESCHELSDQIDRKALVTRHNVIIKEIDSLSSLSVGNGKFAFTVDATGLQSFPVYYEKGIPLGTQSEWGWHTSLNPENYQFNETLRAYNFNGKGNNLYAVHIKDSERSEQAVEYFRTNPHRLQLGNLGLEISKEDGTIAGPNDMKAIRQELNLWTGRIESNFTIEGIPVKVITYCDPIKDAIGFKVESNLINKDQIAIKLRFPYPTNQFTDRGINYENSELHQTDFTKDTNKTLIFNRKLDNDEYFVYASGNCEFEVSKSDDHHYMMLPKAKDAFEMIVDFSPTEMKTEALTLEKIEENSISEWGEFWNSGAAVDFSECTDERAFELERRVVLSQYLTRVQCAGNYPIQETGLTYNSWYGKPHMEMYWWHAAHYPLWGRTEYLEKSMQWFFDVYDEAKMIAERQGYSGVRWQKMTDHQGGEAPSSVGSFLIWQQPHVIYLAEMIYRNNPTKEVIDKYKKLIFSTADFMASYPNYDEANDRYVLGKGVIPAQECFNPLETYNPPYELAYWKWALEKAQEWRARAGLEREVEWQKVLDKLSPMAQKDGVYLAAESVENSYSDSSKHTIDHPAVLAALGMIPFNDYVDLEVMNRTFDIVDKVWTWNHTWGWDFPLEAMTATRLNRPEDAIKALFRDEITNTYLVNGHNYQTDRLSLYLPGNGGILSAIALMCAGYDGCDVENPGFPKDGKWNVKWEGFRKMP